MFGKEVVMSKVDVMSKEEVIGEILRPRGLAG